MIRATLYKDDKIILSWTKNILPFEYGWGIMKSIIFADLFLCLRPWLQLKILKMPTLLS